MITDNIRNLKMYHQLGDQADFILDFIERAKKTKLAPGKYDLLGDELFALVQEYETKDDSECLPESHEQYADLQYMMEGREIMGWQLTDGLAMLEDRRPEADIMFYKKTERMADIKLNRDMFVLLYPEDAHTPCIRYEEKAKVRKIVFKIKQQDRKNK